MPYLEIAEVVLIQCNVLNNSYQQNSRVLYTYMRNKSCAQLLNISRKYFIFLKNLIQNVHILKYGLLIKILGH